MSASNTTYMIHRDCLPVIKGKYWFKLTYKPILDSMTVRFDLSRGATELRCKPFEYDYDSIEKACITSESDCNVYTIVSGDTLSYTDNGITYLPVTSQEAQIYAQSLIGTSYIKDSQLIKITHSNYLDHIDQLIGLTFIDFSVSNQIKQIVNNSNISSECDQVDINYFYEVSEE